MSAVMGKARADNTDMSTIEITEECEKNLGPTSEFLLVNGNSDYNKQGSRNANELVSPRQIA
jgi:hypothetical protein